VALVDNNMDDSKIRMNKCVRKNLRVRLGGILFFYFIKVKKKLFLFLLI